MSIFMIILIFIFLFINITHTLDYSENQFICDFANAFLSFSIKVDGWSCIGNTPILDVCDGSNSNWSGIECNDNIIVGISLSSFGIIGTISSSLGSLTHLAFLHLDNNYLFSTIPSTLGNLVNLGNLDLNNNNINGTVPSTISDFASLYEIDISNNKISGAIPDSIWKLPRIISLTANYNRFTGTLSSTLMYATNLKSIEIGGNSLIGSIPTIIGLLTGLTHLSLQFNSFTGTIPSELGYLTKLAIIYLHSNQFTGSLPATLIHIPDLSKIFFSYNSFTGTIPSCLWSSPRMLYIDFSHNSITGTIPTSIRNGTLMQKLAITNTLLHGTLPSEIGYLTNLQYLYLSTNQLTGTLPSTFGKLKQLQYLDLHSNAFRGTLPPSLRSLPMLVDVYLRGNQLEGPFSQAVNTTYQPMLRNIDISDNHLTGTIPYELFLSSTLEILAATSNCIDFPELAAGCTASKLQVLSLDGIRTAENCRMLFLWSMTLKSRSYTLPDYRGTTIPACLYSLPLLQVLHLSGNALSGTIPANVVLGPNLKDLTLSYNHLHGPIPEAIQRRNWTTLDLSFNSLSGTLSTSIPTISNRKFDLTVNRLSGLVPHSLLQSSDIAILKGNIFGCDFRAAKLPPGDEDSASYSCGSDTFYLALYIFLTALLTNCFVYFIRSPELVRNHLGSLSPMCNGSELSEFIVKFCVLLGVTTLYIVCVMMPVFGALSRYYGTHSYVYAWSVSAGFLSGHNAKVIMLVVWSGMLMLFLVSYWIVFKSSRSKAAEMRTLALEAPLVAQRSTGRPRGLFWDNFVLSVLFGINIVIVFTANAVYVLTTLRGDAYAVTIAQILLGIFKVIWRYGYIEYIGTFRDWITGHTHRNKHELLFLTLTLTINNVVLPVFSETVIDTNCIYNIFVAPDPITSSYTYNTCYLQDAVCDVLTEAAVDISYTPPVIYRYQCTATIITNYVSVYCYMFIFTALQIPLSSLVVWLRGCFRSGSWVYSMISLGVHQLHDNPPHLNYPLYVAGLLSSLAGLLTFGAAFPPLAVIIMISVYVDAIYVTSILPKEVEPVQVDDAGIALYLIPFSALFFSFFSYDTSDYNEENAAANLWAPLLSILIGFLYNRMYKISKLVKNRLRINSVVSPSLQRQREVSLSNLDVLFENSNADSEKCQAAEFN